MRSHGDRGPALATRGGGVLAIAALTLLGSGCAASPEDAPSVLVSEKAGDKSEKPAEPIDFGSKPLWDENPRNDTGVSAFERSRIVGDRVVYNRYAAGYESTLHVAHAETGKTEWKLADDDPITDSGLTSDDDPITDSGGLTSDLGAVHPLGESAKATVLIVKYRETTTLDDGSPGEENGIAALSMTTGELLWHVPVVTGPKHGHNLFIESSTGEYIAVGVSEVDDDTDTDDLAVIGVEQRDVLWQKKNLTAAGVVGDTVLAQKSTKDGKNGELRAFKASSGKTRWKVGEDSDPAVLELTADAVIVSVSGATSVLDPDTGDTRATVDVSATVCRLDGETLACQAQDEDGLPVSAISTITLSRDSAKAHPVPESDEYSLIGFYKGRIFTERRAREGYDFRMLDDAGNTIAEKLPGRLVDITGDYAVFTTPGPGSETLLVHKAEL